MLPLTREMILLCKAVQYCRDGTEDLEWVHGNIEMDKLTRLARRHGVIGMVMPYLEHRACEFETLIANLKPLLVRQVILEALRLKQLEGLVGAFEKHNVSYVVFKGLAVNAQMCDAPISTQRFSTDIDLLVNPADFPQLVSIMHQRGYYCIDCDNASDVAHFASHSADELVKRGLVFRHQDRHVADVDAHWRVANTFSLPLSTATVLGHKQSTQINGVRVFAPSFEHHFLILTVHGYLDYFYQLKHLADLHYAMQHAEYNEAKLFTLAKEFGISQHLAESIELVHVLLEGKVSDLRNSSRYVRTTIERYQTHHGLPPRAHKSHDNWTLIDKLSYILRQINTRSCKASLIAPIQNRLLVKFQQVPKHDSVQSPMS
ncbi:nucleotidyltransferase family protein [Arenicella xantha]|nr:nucleotidyltransferase family protein [Arenicella xantha]